MQKHSKATNRGRTQVSPEPTTKAAARQSTGRQTGASSSVKRLEMNLDRMTIGLDIGDKKSNYCVLGPDGETLLEGKVATQAEAIRSQFSAYSESRVVIEVGTHSAWVEETLRGCGHEVIVANPRKMEASKRRKKNDKEDARLLARRGRVDPESLYPIQQRGVEARRGLALVRMRAAAVEVRTKLINTVRGIVKTTGQRLPACSSEAFLRRAKEQIPGQLREYAAPLLKALESVQEAIYGYDAEVEKLAEETYGDPTRQLRQVKGVGALTSLTYVLAIEDAKRFNKSRDVGPYLGLVPQQRDSGENTPQLRITKAGNEDLRRLLVSSAHYILGPFGEDSDLRRFGLAMSERGGRNGKKRAVVAVARRLAVLLHRLWVSGGLYEPLRNTQLGEAMQKDGSGSREKKVEKKTARQSKARAA